MADNTAIGKATEAAPMTVRSEPEVDNFWALTAAVSFSPVSVILAIAVAPDMGSRVVVVTAIEGDAFAASTSAAGAAITEEATRTIEIIAE